MGLVQSSVYQFEHHYTTALRAGARIGLHYSLHNFISSKEDCLSIKLNQRFQENGIELCAACTFLAVSLLV